MARRVLYAGNVRRLARVITCPKCGSLPRVECRSVESGHMYEARAYYHADRMTHAVRLLEDLGTLTAEGFLSVTIIDDIGIKDVSKHEAPAAPKKDEAPVAPAPPAKIEADDGDGDGDGGDDAQS